MSSAEAKQPIHEEEDSEAQLYQQTREQLGGLQRQVFAVQSQINNDQRRLRRNQLTVSELEKVDDNVPTFKPVGRMFIRQTSSAIRAELSEEDKKVEEELESLKAKLTYLVKEKEAAEAQLDELASKLQSAQLTQQ